MIPRLIWGMPSINEIQNVKKREREKESQRRKDEELIEQLREERISGVRIKVASRIVI